MKYLVGLFAAALLSSVLMVATTTTSANAAYPYSVPTKCGLIINRAQAFARVTSPTTKAQPWGKYGVGIKENGRNIRYTGGRFGRALIKKSGFRGLPNGVYSARMVANPGPKRYQWCTMVVAVEFGD